MTLQERMALIEGKAAADRKAEEKEKALEEQRYAEALRKIEELTPRIADLITLANKCIELGISFPSPKETKNFGYGTGSYSFIADGFYHHVGFMHTRHHDSPVTYMGIDEGGACGVWDFFTNGKDTLLRHESDPTREKDPEYWYMENFLKEFDSFESAFYKWIDSLAPVPEKEPVAKEPLYRPRLTENSDTCILCDSVWDWEKALDYADKHNLDVLYTETGSSDLIKTLMAFSKRGFSIELKERPVYAPGGLLLSPKIEVLFSKPTNIVKEQ